MTISKRELQLSQDLMDLQRQYNALLTSNNDALSRIIVLESERNVLNDEVLYLKDKIKKKQASVNSLSRDNGIARRQCNKGCFLN